MIENQCVHYLWNCTEQNLARYFILTIYNHCLCDIMLGLCRYWFSSLFVLMMHTCIYLVHMYCAYCLLLYCILSVQGHRNHITRVDLSPLGLRWGGAQPPLECQLIDWTRLYSACILRPEAWTLSTHSTMSMNDLWNHSTTISVWSCLSPPNCTHLPTLLLYCTAYPLFLLMMHIYTCLLLDYMKWKYSVILHLTSQLRIMEVAPIALTVKLLTGPI